jgi:hypothetical protein
MSHQCGRGNPAAQEALFTVSDPGRARVGLRLVTLRFVDD